MGIQSKTQIEFNKNHCYLATLISQGSQGHNGLLIQEQNGWVIRIRHTFSSNM